MTPTDERFEDRLLRELRRVVAERRAPASEAERFAPPPRPARRLTLPRVAVGGATAAAAAAAVVALTAGGAAEPAYAVEPRDDGSVTVEINDLRDAGGLERKLRAAGIPAAVDYLPDSKACREPRFAQPRTGPEAPRARHSLMMEVRDGSTRFTLPRDGLGEGQTLVIVSNVGAGVSSVAVAIADGPVAPCEPVDAPVGDVPPPGAGAGDGPSHSVAPDPGAAAAGDGPSHSVAPDPGAAGGRGMQRSGG